MATAALAFDSMPSMGKRINVRVPTPTRVTGHATYKAHVMDYVDMFNQHLHEWRAETVFMSSTQDMMNNAAFKKIVKLGDAVVPLIIDELKRQPDFLFLALHAITKESPVVKGKGGNVQRVIDAWLAWAERNAINDD